MTGQTQANALQPKYALSATSLTLLNLTPPVFVALLSHNLIDRADFSITSKLFLYGLALGSTAKSFSYTKGLLFEHKTHNNENRSQQEMTDVGVETTRRNTA